MFPIFTMGKHDFNERFGVHFIDKKVDSDSIHCQTLKCCKKHGRTAVQRLKPIPAKLFTYVARVRYVDGKPLFFLNHYFEKPEPEEVIAAGEINPSMTFIKTWLKLLMYRNALKQWLPIKNLATSFPVPFDFRF